MTVQLLCNSLWALLCLPERLALAHACHSVAATQRRLLLYTLQRNAKSDYGRRYGFAAIRSVAEFQARVPLSDYADYAAPLERIAAGEPGVLTREPVLLLEPTSGSTAATKLVPYTATLKAEFNRAIAAWVAELYRQQPGLLGGQAYWSVTPVARANSRSAGGLPIGFEDDSAYLSRRQGWLLRRLLAVPTQVRLLDDLETFRYVTLLFLVRSRTLALISVWHPSFLALLADRLADWYGQLAADLAAGSLTPPGRIDAAQQGWLAALLRPDPRRAAELRAAMGAPTAAQRHAQLWPGLRLISCWADGAAQRPAAALAELFPQARLQPKGLLATEGCISLPLGPGPGAALALRSHFFEFLPLDTDTPLLAHQLALGGQYRVVMTSGGGLYRYQLHDAIEVVGWHGECPLVYFLGKTAAVADHYGEKLHAHHVEAALDALLAQFQLAPAFAMLACEQPGGQAAYVLFIEAAAHDETLCALGAALDTRLGENYHYRYCRELGQLAALRVFRVVGGAASYLAGCLAHGQRLGDIKPTALHRQSGWLVHFRGRWLDVAQRP